MKSHLTRSAATPADARADPFEVRPCDSRFTRRHPRFTSGYRRFRFRTSAFRSRATAVRGGRSATNRPEPGFNSVRCARRSDRSPLTLLRLASRCARSAFPGRRTAPDSVDPALGSEPTGSRSETTACRRPRVRSNHLPTTSSQLRPARTRLSHAPSHGVRGRHSPTRASRLSKDVPRRLQTGRSRARASVGTTGARRSNATATTTWEARRLRRRSRHRPVGRRLARVAPDRSPCGRRRLVIGSPSPGRTLRPPQSRPGCQHRRETDARRNRSEIEWRPAPNPPRTATRPTPRRRNRVVPATASSWL